MFKNGLTKVRVMRRTINEQNRRESIEKVKEGIVVEHGSHFARVYNNAPVQDGGDASMVTAEKFPFQSRNCWLEITGELKYSIRLAPELTK
jgi:hypothetical protein